MKKLLVLLFALPLVANAQRTIFDTGSLRNGSVKTNHLDSVAYGLLTAGGVPTINDGSLTTNKIDSTFHGLLTTRDFEGKSLAIHSANPAGIPMVARGSINQASNIFEVQSSNNTTLFGVGPTGAVTAASFSGAVNWTNLVGAPAVVTNAGAITYTLSADTGYTLGTNIDITHPTGWVYADIEAIGSGGGGASGGCHTNGVVSKGGGSGSPGSYTKRRIYSAEVTKTFFRCTIGAGGVGGASVSTDADGNAGSNGTSSIVKDGDSTTYVVYAFRGAGGALSSAATTVGSEFMVVSGAASSGTGAAGPAGSNGPVGSGGAGGGITTGNAWSAGGASGYTQSAPVDANYLAEVTAGGATEGASGADGVSSATFGPGRSGGGGASSVSGNAGAGGNGGKYGASGGGGGGARLGTGSSGKGGNGAPGIIKIAYVLAFGSTGSGGSVTLTNFTATAPLYVAASATNVTLWLTNATASVPGSMSAAHYTKLEALNAANYQPTNSYLTALSTGTATLVELTATTLNATTYNVSTQNVGTLNITNNVAITYGTSVSNVVDFLKAESLINVGGNITYTHATNGASGQSITHIVTMPNWSGTTRTLTIPAAWKTNFFSPVPPSLTNGTITTMYVRAINATGDAANQTNVMVSFDHSK